MMRLPWALLGIVLPLGLTLACGSGEDRPSGGSGGSGSSGGDDAGSSGGSESSGGRSSGGSGNSSGVGGSGGATPRDTEAPAFEGATGVDVTGAEDRVRVLWSAATDDVSPEKRIAYRVYRASESGGQDFARARRCGDADPTLSPTEAAKLPCFVTSGAGATNALVRDVLPAHPYFFVARAVDEAGNEDENTNQVSAQTDDTTSPEFGGVRSVNVTSATSLRVTWGPGYDVASSDAELKFNVYAAAGKDPDPGKDKPIHESGAGEHEAIVTGLEPLTAYRVIVRAVDPTGNEDGNERVLGATTPEGLPPTFDGVKNGLEEGLADDKKARVRVFWAPATDNVTDSANILYDVYQSTRSHGQNFNRPSYTSLPGASSILISGLEPGTRYYFSVRARDVGGNQDTNIKEIFVSTRTIDQTPPVFSGITTATSSTPTSVGLAWGSATDGVTRPGGFKYLIYMSEATPVDTNGSPHLIVGGTSPTVGGLESATTYHFVVRVRDEAGNLSTGVVERTATTLAADLTDTVAPDFAAGNVQAAINTSTTTNMGLSWTAATDASGAANIRYHVCASMIQTDCQGADFFRHVVLTTNFAAVSAVASFLTSRTDYFFLVRAEDRSGNVSASAPFVRRATATSFATNVLPILASRCGACHNFSTVGLIKDVQSQVNWACPTGDPFKGCPLDLIEPAAPEFSAIYRKVNPPNLKTSPFSEAVPNEYGGLQEPRDSQDKLTGAEDDALRTWIAQGAFGN